MLQAHKHALQSNLHNICDECNYRDVLIYLLGNGIILPGQAEEIRAESRNDMSVMKLIEYVKAAGPKAFEEFINALHRIGKNSLADTIQAGLPSTQRVQVRHPVEHRAKTGSESSTQQTSKAKTKRKETGEASGKGKSKLDEEEDDDPDDSDDSDDSDGNAKEGKTVKPRTKTKCYDAPYIKDGLALILNVEKNRQGSNVDSEILQDALEARGFEIVAPDPAKLTGSGILEEIKAFIQRKRLKHVGAAIVCVLAHGTETTFQGSDGLDFPIRSLTHHLSPNKCPNLRNKPKLIFIQACRVDRFSEKLKDEDKKLGPSSDSASDENCGNGIHDGKDVDDDPKKLAKKLDEWAGIKEDMEETDDGDESISQWDDFLISYATGWGYTATRDPTKGSVYINTLVEVLNDYPKWEIRKQLDKVRELVMKKRQGKSIMQSPGYTSHLAKKVFLKPPQE